MNDTMIGKQSRDYVNRIRTKLNYHFYLFARGTIEIRGFCVL